MDNFLQLVPMEADADDSDSALVYGEEDDLTVHEGGEPHDVLSESSAAAADATADAANGSAAQFFAPLAQFVAASAHVSATPPTTNASPPPPMSRALTPEQQRARFLRLLQMAMESATYAVRVDLDKRLDAVHRIRSLDAPPAQQIAEYVPLLAAQRREHDVRSASEDDEDTGVATGLLACARQLSDPRDAEVALLAAFVFLSDASRQRSRGSIAPAVAAALIDESNAALLGEHHHQQHHHHRPF